MPFEMEPKLVFLLSTTPSSMLCTQLKKLPMIKNIKLFMVQQDAPFFMGKFICRII
jgi:hypothetical protein